MQVVELKPVFQDDVTEYLSPEEQAESDAIRDAQNWPRNHQAETFRAFRPSVEAQKQLELSFNAAVAQVDKDLA